MKQCPIRWLNVRLEVQDRVKPPVAKLVIADFKYKFWCECRAPHGTHTKIYTWIKQRQIELIYVADAIG
jgi:hypothetical protein